MKRILFLCAVLTLTLCACGSSEPPEPEETTEPIPVIEETNPESTHSQRYFDILGNDYDLLEESRIRYDGKYYVYHSAVGITDYVGMAKVGTLSHSRDGDKEMSTDCEILDGGTVYALTGGLSDGLLQVTKKDPDTGAIWNALYIPEDKTYPEEYEYRENEDGTITILKYRGNEEDVVVPAELDGKKVTSVSGAGEGAFSNCARVASVTIPEGVTLVNDNTFYGCQRLQKVTFPASLTNIGHCAFNRCPDLGEICFEGDAPALGNYILDAPWDGITVYHRETTKGWDKKPWNACRLETF